MSIDYSIWGQHTVAEARYTGNKTAIHIRIPAQVVIEARDLFTTAHLGEFDPCVELSQQPYQFHIFNATSCDAYIHNVPFEQVKSLLWYLHRNPQERATLLWKNTNTEFKEYIEDNELSDKPGLVWLYAGHEKYGFFDLIPENSFLFMQMHRAALYGTFLKELGYVCEDKDLKETLPESVIEQVKKGVPLTSIVEKMSRVVEHGIDFRLDGKHSIHSGLESLTLIVDEGSPELIQGNLMVCEDHEPLVYWTTYKGRMIYRRVNPNQKGDEKIIEKLKYLEKKKCPKCEESVLAR